MASINARKKKLIEDLRYAQMHVRLDLHALERSKEEARLVAAKLRELQKEFYAKR